jgi:hypothetical protein
MSATPPPPPYGLGLFRQNATTGRNTNKRRGLKRSVRVPLDSMLLMKNRRHKLLGTPKNRKKNKNNTRRRSKSI